MGGNDLSGLNVSLRVHVAVAPDRWQLHPGPTTSFRRRPAGISSVTRVSPAVSALPLLKTSIVNCSSDCPARTGAGCDFRMDSWAAPTIVVGSAALLSAGVASPPPLTVATLVSVPGRARTFTAIVIEGHDRCPARLSVRRHDTTCAWIVHVHPSPLAAVGTSWAGSESCITTGPEVGVIEMLRTVTT